MSAAQIERKRAELLAACRGRAIPVTGDDHVPEACAAQLLGLAPGTLRNWRGLHRPIPYRRTGGRGHGRIWYSLAAISTYLLDAERASDAES